MAFSPPSERPFRCFLAGCCLLFAACHGGENKTILKPMVRAALTQTSPPQNDGVIFFDNVTPIGDTLSLDVVVRDSTGNLAIDSIDLVIRYDARFIQVLSVAGQNTLFGTCNTVNPTCGVNSPICVNNRTQANGGGDNFCRKLGSAACTLDTDCTASMDCGGDPDCTGLADECGSFGLLQASFVVLTGPKVCSNNTSRSCSADADCQLCSNDPDTACTSPSDCGGNLCDSGICQNSTGCSAVTVSQTQKIANLTLRVTQPGCSEIRFVISSNVQGVASFARKDLAELPVLFFPNVDADDLTLKAGCITVKGTL